MVPIDRQYRSAKEEKQGKTTGDVRTTRQQARMATLPCPVFMDHRMEVQLPWRNPHVSARTVPAPPVSDPPQLSWYALSPKNLTVKFERTF